MFKLNSTVSTSMVKRMIDWLSIFRYLSLTLVIYSLDISNIFQVLITKYETGQYRQFRGWTLYPANRIGLLPETLRGLRLEASATVVLSCVSTILVEAGSSEPQETRLPEVFQVLKDFSTFVLSFCEDSRVPGLQVAMYIFSTMFVLYTFLFRVSYLCNYSSVL
jgi:hypothetical protein